MSEHRCKDFQKAKSLGYTYGQIGSWEIVRNELWAEDEYGIEIKFCPFCGKELGLFSNDKKVKK